MHMPSLRLRVGALLQALCGLAAFVLLVRLTLYIAIEFLGVAPGEPAGYSWIASATGIVFDGLIVVLALVLCRWVHRLDWARRAPLFLL